MMVHDNESLTINRSETKTANPLSRKHIYVKIKHNNITYSILLLYKSTRKVQYDNRSNRTNKFV